MDGSERVRELVCACRRKAAGKAREWGELAGLAKRLALIRRERRSLYTRIGCACWSERRRETAPYFGAQFGRLSALAEEERAVERRIRALRGESMP